MCWTWGPYMGGWWWIFPLVGIMFMIAMMFLCSGFFRGRGCFYGLGRHDASEDLKREIRDLKEQISQLKRTGG